MGPADLDALTSPLMPLASRTHRRATFEAERRGLVCVPHTFPLPVVGPSATSTVLTVTPSKDSGPIVVTEIIPPQRSVHLGQFMRARVNQDWKTDGSILARDALVVPRNYCGRLMSSPLCVAGGQNLQLSFDSDADYVATTDGASVNALGVRAMQRNRRTLCEVPLDVSAEWLEAVKFGGEWWAMTIVGRAGGATTGLITGDVVIEAVVLAQKTLAIEDQGHATDVQVKIGSTVELTPSTGPLTYGVADSPDTVTVLPGLRYPVVGGTTVTLDLAFTAVTPIPVRVTLLGRRGGLSGACW